MTNTEAPPYPARLSISYPDRPLDRLSTALRLLYALPILMVLSLLGEVLMLPAAAMIVARQKYPRWWFDFNVEYARFSTRVSAYMLLMSDEYPSTEEPQYVDLELDYPDVERDLNRWLPIVKWLLVIPHLLVLALLGMLLAAIAAWFVILVNGRYPRGIFDFVEGVLRWALRVEAYAFLLTTDRYPPFSLR